MEFLFDIFSSAGFGTLLGGVFGWLGKREERENLKMKMAHEVEMLKARTKSQVEIAQANIEEAKVAGSLAVEKEETAAFRESQKKTSNIAEIVKSFVRPVILAILLYQTYLIHKNVDVLVGKLGTLTNDEIIGIYKILILSIISLTSTAVGWYFAQRTSKQFDKLLDINFPTRA